MYDGGPPPWDIGRPQPTFVELADQGLLVGRVLDIGCGTGEHALMAAARGLDATGIDAVPKAIGQAQRKAEDRGLTVRFLVADALRLADLGEQFDTVLDSGLFHIFSDEDRPRFVASLGTAISAGGHYYLLCFSDRQPGTMGPRRVSESEIRESIRASGLAGRRHRCRDDGHQHGADSRLASEHQPRVSRGRASPRQARFLAARRAT